MTDTEDKKSLSVDEVNNLDYITRDNIQEEMESYRKELYNLGMLMQNIIMDKKIYLEKLKDKNE